MTQLAKEPQPLENTPVLDALKPKVGRRPGFLLPEISPIPVILPVSDAAKSRSYFWLGLLLMGIATGAAAMLLNMQPPKLVAVKPKLIVPGLQVDTEELMKILTQE